MKVLFPHQFQQKLRQANMSKRKLPTELTIAEFMKLRNNDRKVFVTGYVYGELGVNAFGIIDKTNSIKVEYDESYKKTRSLSVFGNFIRIYGGTLKKNVIILNSRSSIFPTGPIEYGEVPKLNYKAEPCIDEYTREPGLVSFK